MDKIKLDRVLFEFMEGITKPKIYNYELFIHSLLDTVDYSNKLHCEDSKWAEWAELKPYFAKNKREETLEKLLKAYMFGYEEKDDRYTIVLFEKGGCEFVLWEIKGEYVADIRDSFNESESSKKTFTRAEILNKFPKLWPLAQKDKK